MKKVIIALAVAASLTAAGVATATIKTIQLPPDGVQWKPSALPGYAKATANCLRCHSAEYAQYQPSTAARPYWESMVKRMKTVFKAPIDDADIPDLVDYLTKVYGNEQAAK